MRDKIKSILLKPEHRDAVTDELIDELQDLFNEYIDKILKEQ